MLDRKNFELEYMRGVQEKYKGLSSIKKQKLEAYGYLVEAVRLLEE